MTVSGDAGYGKTYFVLGLAINAAIFSSIIFWLLSSPKPLHDLRRLLTPPRIICVVLCVLFVVYGRPILALVYTKWQARNAPEMWIVPIPLPDLPAERSAGRTFSYFGYEFDSPWTEVKRERKLESIAVLNFSNGAFISILDPARGSDELQAMKREATKRGTDIRNAFGDEVTRSNYALRSKILYLTPKDLHILSSRQEMVGNSILLLLKSIWTKRIEGGLYSFQTEWLRGFQEGIPTRDKMAIIDGFDAQDREVEVWVGSEEGANKPSQADVNRILYSLRPVVASSPH